MMTIQTKLLFYWMSSCAIEFLQDSYEASLEILKGVYKKTDKQKQKKSIHVKLDAAQYHKRQVVQGGVARMT